MAEKCAQCTTAADKHPVVGIMNVGDVALLLNAKGLKPEETVVGVDPGKTWIAVAMCAKCHQEPKLKAHYFMRGDETIALRLANMTNLTMPTQVK